MGTTDFKIRRLEVVADAATSFLAEGYLMQVSYKSLGMCYYKLRHRSNGNTIEVKARPVENLMEVYKNGKRVKLGTITQ